MSLPDFTFREPDVVVRKDDQRYADFRWDTGVRVDRDRIGGGGGTVYAELTCLHDKGSKRFIADLHVVVVGQGSAVRTFSRSSAQVGGDVLSRPVSRYTKAAADVFERDALEQVRQMLDEETPSTLRAFAGEGAMS